MFPGCNAALLKIGSALARHGENLAYIRSGANPAEVETVCGITDEIDVDRASDGVSLCPASPAP